MEGMFERALVEHCAPTLAGVKPANLFCICKMPPELARRLAEEWDYALKPMAIRIRVLKERPETGSSTIYVYRPDWLKQILADEDNQAFLERAGYSGTDYEDILAQLSGRLRPDREFPHEIGLFLGYPLEDVIGFIRNQGKNCTCCGCWKSYGDPTAAQKCFARYRACTSIYKRMYGNGTPIIQLVRAV